MIFNHERFIASLNLARKMRRIKNLDELPWFKVADYAKISPSTITRILQGKTPDLDTFAKLCKWMACDTSYFFDYDRKVNNQPDHIELLEMLITAYEAHKRLNKDNK